MKFKESRYIPNSEIKRLSTIMADVMFEKYDNMGCTLNYCDASQLLENTDERSDQNNDNKS